MDADEIKALVAATAREQQESVQQLIAEFVISQVLELAEVTTEAVYVLKTPVRMVGDFTHDRLEQVRVRISRWPHPTCEEDGGGEVLVEGFLRPLNMDGRPRRNGVATWRRLPERLAAQLLMRALTES